MTTRFFTFAVFFVSTANCSIFAGFILFLSTNFLIPVIQNIINFFYIEKLIIKAKNTITLIFLKIILLISKVSFLSLNHTWKSILIIFNQL